MEKLTLREKMESWLNGNAKRTKGLLAKKSGVSEMTIARILQKENASSVETTLAICDAIATREEMVSIIDSEHPRVAAAMNRYISARGNQTEPSEEQKDAVSRFLSNDRSISLIMHAFCRSGISEADATALHGIPGVEILEEMVDARILKKVRDCYYGAFESLTVENADTLRRMSESALRAFDPRTVGQGAWLSLDWDSVNDRGAELVREALRKATLEVNAILTSPENLGDLPIYAVIGTNFLDTRGRRGGN